MRRWGSWIARAWIWLLPLGFLTLFLGLPLARIFALAAAREGGPGLSWLQVARPLGFTLYQATLSTALTLLAGLPAAWAFSRYRFAGREALRLLTVLPFILPTVVVAASFNALLGPNGWVNVALMQAFDLSSPPLRLLNTLPAIVLAHVFYNVSVIVRVVGSAWEQLDSRLEHGARVLGATAWRAFWEVTLPLLRPALTSALLLVFMYDFTSFGVVLMLGGPRYATLEVEIYTQAAQLLNLPAAALLSAVQLGFTVALSALYTWVDQRNAATATAQRVRGEGLRAPKGFKEKLAVAVTAGGLALMLAAPLVALTLRSVVDPASGRLTLAFYQELFINRRASIFYVPPVAAVRNSLVYAAMAVTLALGMGGPASWAAARRGWGARVVQGLTLLPLGASAVTLGLGYLVTFSRAPFNWLSSPWLVPAAHALVALPLVVRTLQPALAAIPPSYRQAAAVLGAGPLRAWWEVELPLAARAMLVAAIFAFTISLGEFGATSFLSRPEYPTLPVAVYRFLGQPGAMNYGQGMAASVLLLAVCAAAVALIERFQPAGKKGF